MKKEENQAPTQCIVRFGSTVCFRYVVKCDSRTLRLPACLRHPIPNVSLPRFTTHGSVVFNSAVLHVVCHYLNLVGHLVSSGPPPQLERPLP